MTVGVIVRLNEEALLKHCIVKCLGLFSALSHSNFKSNSLRCNKSMCIINYCSFALRKFLSRRSVNSTVLEQLCLLNGMMCSHV